MANDLMSASRPSNTLTQTGNMLGLGFIEIAVKDIVHYAYYNIAEKNKTFDGVVYPQIKWQNNTGINGTGVNSAYSIPKHFENTATSVIDLGPLYDFAPRIDGGVYLNISAAVNYWNQTFHKSRQFLLGLRYYARYHYYIARSIEEYLFGGQNSTFAPVTRTSALGNWTAAKDTIFEQARRSTIRFSQALLEQACLQIFLDNDQNTEGYHHAFFDQYFRQDEWQTRMEAGLPWTNSPRPSVRYSAEFAGDKVRADLGQYALSGLDHFISLRNDQWDTTSYTMLQTANCDGITPQDPALTWEILSAQHTPLSKYGARIRSSYSSELKWNLYQAAELGLGDYASHVAGLTPTNGTVNAPSVSDLNTTQKAYNVLYGSMKETNSIRKFRGRTALVATAATFVINDVLIVDRTSYWARNSSGVPQGYKFHSKIFKTPDDGTSFYTYCYKVGGVCTDQSTDAGVILFATHPHINDFWPGLDNAEENQFIWRSRGGLWSSPPTLQQPGDTSSDGQVDYDQRRTAQNQFLTEFINPLYYRFDGLYSHAIKQAGSDNQYLHNQIVDAFPTNIGWNGNYDGLCYTSDAISSCTRDLTNFWSFYCAWNWPF
jgi:hypothetical protein